MGALEEQQGLKYLEAESCCRSCPREKAEFRMKTAIGVAEKLSETKFPSTMILGGGGKGGSSITPIDALGYKSMMDIVNKMNKNSK